MGADWIIAIATVGTFVVITASAVAALIQLRHTHAGNQIAALTELRETLESEEFTRIMYFALWQLPERLTDSSTREALLAPDWSGVPAELRDVAKVANVFESIGVLVKNGILNANVVCDMWSHLALRNWNAMEPFITNRRLLLENPAINENFEYIAVLSAHWLEKHPAGTYPRNMPRMPHSPPWPELQNRATTPHIGRESPSLIGNGR